MKEVSSGTVLINCVYWVKPLEVLNVPAMKFDGFNEKSISEILGDCHVSTARTADGKRKLIISGPEETLEVFQGQYIVVRTNDEIDVVDALDEEHGYKLQSKITTENHYVEYEEEDI